MSVQLIDITPNAMEKLALVASVCYQSQPSEKVVKKILDMGHWSVFEHCYATFKIDMSVAVLLQITRHRHLSFTVQSSRVTELKNWREPEDEHVALEVARAMEEYCVRFSSGRYSPEDLMYMLPKAAMYQVYVTGNFRAWLEYLPKRMCQRALQEHRAIANEISRILTAKYPDIFGKIGPNCQRCNEKNCEFTSRGQGGRKS